MTSLSLSNKKFIATNNENTYAYARMLTGIIRCRRERHEWSHVLTFSEILFVNVITMNAALNSVTPHLMP